MHIVSGRKITTNCVSALFTCKLISEFPVHIVSGRKITTNCVSALLTCKLISEFPVHIVSGRKITANCLRAPFTCKLISEFPAARDCRRGQAKFSVMQAGTHVWPHCGPTNCRLRSHLGLVVPHGTFIRVAEEVR